MIVRPATEHFRHALSWQAISAAGSRWRLCAGSVEVPRGLAETNAPVQWSIGRDRAGVQPRYSAVLGHFAYVYDAVDTSSVGPIRSKRGQP